ncbi:hypothetical protein GCM10010218_49410 [Streptomyces mashuensis]|uniref:Cytochrome C oxidase subunit I n=1 Tax=Streptomyces mashuensis TaxID=33904 RepID=A0A919EF27_9ACTN|nr:hypothetical protein [Streptomyces mashuensis]GHF61907.1 hypothetical protein GCM10010218_49410 [Streptomyces mashuensis]
MSATRTTTKTTAEAINEIEGYLLWESEKSRARERARAFTAALPWLTEAQREAVEHRYAQDHLAASRDHLRRIAHRSGELRTEYEAVHRTLKRRMTAWCTTCTALTTVTVLLTLLSHR